MERAGESEAMSTQEIVRAKVLPLLKAKLPDDQWKMLKLEMTTEVEAKINSQSKQRDLGSLQDAICLWIQRASKAQGTPVPLEDADAVAIEAAEAVKTALSQASDAQPALSKEDLELLKTAFKAKYVGDAHAKFKEYLWRCWEVYTSLVYKAPYVAVVQSSGFGKSRMLYQLGLQARNPSSRMKVLYMCTRLQESTGYPVATHDLRRWLFAANFTAADIAERLGAIYYRAMDRWDKVQDAWIKLFTDCAQDSVEAAELAKTLLALREKRSSNKPSPPSKEDVPSDAEPKSTLKDPDGKMVVVVIDEARALLGGGNAEEGSYFRRLRHALVLANNAIGRAGGIFGVLVDTNSKVSDLTPPLSTDPSSRRIDGKLALFPPFVLTHTMDVKWKEYCRGERMKKQTTTTAVGAGCAAGGDTSETAMESVDCGEGEMDMYKGVVLKGGRQAWHALTRMGRPLWASTLTHGKLEGSGELPTATTSAVVSLAANKLLLGLPPGTNSYTEATMFGVASMLCRLGVRPYSTSPLASRAVADFMAILAYVNYEREGCLSSYASDPVLALGAMRVWYATSNALADHILPQLKKLVLDEALDTGGVGEMVARILMLLAMDKCVLGGKSISECELSGQFVSVASFLEVLGVGDRIHMPVLVKGKTAADDAVQGAFTSWQSQWGGWKMGFNHFIQLELEPNEDTLWQLLGRRAAGIFPRNQYGADLLIPIFREKRSAAKGADEEESKCHVETDSEADPEGEVSAVLIQVKNRHPEDSTFVQSATKKLCPWFVFGEKSKKSADELGEEPGQDLPAEPSLDEASQDNPLRQKPVQEVIRIYMNLRGTQNKFIYATSLADNNPDPEVAIDGSETTPSSSCDETPSDFTTATVGSRNELAAESASESVPEENLEESNAKQLGVKEQKELLPSEAAFTLCFQTICSETYPFVSSEVASRLQNMVEPLWKPMQVVKGDLQRRREAEENEKSAFKAALSKVMSDKELEENAYNGLAHVQGHSKWKHLAKKKTSRGSSTKQHGRDAKKTSKATPKRLRSGEQGGGPSKRRAPMRDLE